MTNVIETERLLIKLLTLSELKLWVNDTLTLEMEYEEFDE